MKPIEILTPREQKEREATERAIQNLHNPEHQEAWRNAQKRGQELIDRVRERLPCEVFRDAHRRITIVASSRYFNSVCIRDERKEVLFWKFQKRTVSEIGVTIGSIGDFISQAELFYSGLGEAQGKKPHTSLEARRTMKHVNYDGNVTLQGTIGRYVLGRYDCMQEKGTEIRLNDWEFRKLLETLKSFHVPLLLMKGEL